jgi:hypothetical protein
MDKLSEMLKELEPKASAMVKAIEAQPKVTKDHYGEYLTVLTRAQDEHSLVAAKVLAIALLKAGANQQGLRAALSIMGVV